MKKVVVKLDLHDDKAKKKALMTVSSVSGIDSLSMDMKEQKLTVVGDADPVEVVSKLRKFWHTEKVTVGPAKEPEKKKEEGKKDEGKKDEKKDKKDQIAEPAGACEAHNPRRTAVYIVESAEEKPNCCVIG